jgi:hypothetical protein
MSDAIPNNVQLFLREHIGSIAQLELLILLRAERQNSLSVEEAAKKLYTALSMTGPLLESLRANGFLTVQEGPPRRYQYAPRNAELEQIVEDVERAYRERRVTITNLIYSAPMQKLQNFADAFRIRKKEDD